MPKQHRDYLLGAVLFLMVCGIYWPVVDYEFINFDDDIYISANPHVLGGVSWKNFQWTFSFSSWDWQPITMLSHMIGIEVFGIDAGGHHLINLLLHGFNAWLLFTTLAAATRRTIPSFIAASIFAVHPIHVESVAWVSERKDVLSFFFGILSIYQYIGFTRTRKKYRYVLSILFFFLALMSKPIMVTLPCILILLDHWPLQRYVLYGGDRSSFFRKIDNLIRQNLRILSEKVPFFLLSAGSSLMTVASFQKHTGLPSIDVISVPLRFQNAVISYAAYILKMFWPFDLAVIYPYRFQPSIIKFGISSAVVAIISLMGIRLFRKYPFFLIGWLWFLGALFPVSGLFQAGSQAMADRFFYFPGVGVYIAIVWGTTAYINNNNLWLGRKKLLSALSAVFFLSVITLSCIQVRYWSDSVHLFTHANRTTENNTIARAHIGSAYLQANNLEKAELHLVDALACNPANAVAKGLLGVLRIQQNRNNEAIQILKSILKNSPGNNDVRTNLAGAYAQMGQFELAEQHFNFVLETNHNDQKALYNFGVMLNDMGRYQEAIAQLEKIMAQTEHHSGALNALGFAYMSIGNLNLAIKAYHRALLINPADAATHHDLGIALARKGTLSNALKHIKTASKLKPNDADIAETLSQIKSIMKPVR